MTTKRRSDLIINIVHVWFVPQNFDHRVYVETRSYHEQNVKALISRKEREEEDKNDLVYNVLIEFGRDKFHELEVIEESRLKTNIHLVKKRIFTCYNEFPTEFTDNETVDK